MPHNTVQDGSCARHSTARHSIHWQRAASCKWVHSGKSSVAIVDSARLSIVPHNPVQDGSYARHGTAQIGSAQPVLSGCTAPTSRCRRSATRRLISCHPAQHNMIKTQASRTQPRVGMCSGAAQLPSMALCKLKQAHSSGTDQLRAALLRPLASLDILFKAVGLHLINMTCHTGRL
jgi:hypothetical protein